MDVFQLTCTEPEPDAAKAVADPTTLADTGTPLAIQNLVDLGYICLHSHFKIHPFEAIAWCGQDWYRYNTLSRWLLQKVPETQDRYRLLPATDTSFVMSPYRVLMLAGNETEGSTHFRLVKSPTEPNAFQLVFANSKQALIPNAASTEGLGNITSAPDSSGKRQLWRFIPCPQTVHPKPLQLPECVWNYSHTYF